MTSPFHSLVNSSRTNKNVETSNRRYSSVAIALHWLMAGLIVFMIWLGQNMENHEARFQLHKSIGISLLFLTLARILWRLYNKPPPLPADVRPLEARLSHAVQFGFYALMLLIPLGGWIMVSMSPFAVPTVLFETISWPNLPLPRNESGYKFLAFLHGKGATLGFLGLLFLHVAGAIKHQISDETGVLRRMFPGKSLLAAKSRGAALSAIIPLGLFAAIAILPNLSSAGEAVKDPAQTELFDSNWITDSGEITFSGVHDGNAFSGTFSKWDTQIAFHPEDLGRSNVSVTIDLTSAATGTKLYDDSLKAAEWFDTKTNPNAIVHLSDFKSTSDGYQVTAKLTLKDKTVSAPFNFSLDIKDSIAVMKGETVFTRKALELGQDSDADAEWVSEDIRVGVVLTAKKKP